MRSTPSTRPRGARSRLAAGLGAAALLAVPAVAAAQTGTAEVVVVHGVPDLVVDILIDGEVAIEAMEFADAPIVTTLPEGDVEIVVAATGTTDPVLSLDATLTSGTSVTVAAHLDALGAPKLALVTCGGAFDPVARRYAENVIVWAVPGARRGRRLRAARGRTRVADTVPETASEPLRYKLLTGTGDREFCEKVSRHLEGGYVLYGEPVIASDRDGAVTVAQAVVLRGA